MRGGARFACPLQNALHSLQNENLRGTRDNRISATIQDDDVASGRVARIGVEDIG